VLTKVSEIQTITDELRLYVRYSRGWWKRIAAQSGCRYHTLKRFAEDPTYDPKCSDAAKVHAWFLENGVKEKGPQGRLKRVPDPVPA
jgi:hypothetical protein